MNEQLKIIISATVDKLKQEVNKASKTVKDFSKSTETEGKKVNKAFDKMGEAAKKAGAAISKAFVAGTAAAVAGVAALTGSAIKAYAEYEQLVGGVDTLFKDSSKKLQEYAANAYKSAGMSANQYMELTTSFSAALIQSLGGDTEAAVKYADMAITDMADNANKMGTSMESIQNAYQGFAKQNYTMLDNLKLGYGGTKEEMQRLLKDAEKIAGVKFDISSYSDVVEAIHVVQKELGITGTTADEAYRTINGSVNMTKASWSNLVRGIADDNADFQKLIDDFVESFGYAAQNIIPRIEIALNGVAQLIETLLPIIIARVPEVINNMLPQILESAVNIVMALIDGIILTLPVLLETFIGIVPMLIEKITEVLPELINLGVQLIVSLLEGVSQMLPEVILAIVELIPMIVDTLVENIPVLLDAAIQFFTALIDAIPIILPELINMLPEVVDKVATTLIDNLPVLMDAALELFMALVEAIPQILPDLLVAISKVLDTLLNKVLEAVPDLLSAGMDLIVGVAKGMVQAIPSIVAACGNIVAQIGKFLVDAVKKIMKFEWSLPKLKLPHVSIHGSFSLVPPSIPSFSIAWYAKGGVFDNPTLFPYGGSIGGLGEAGAEAIVPLENNTEWLDKIAERLSEKSGTTPIILQVDGKTFAQTSISTINQLTRQSGKLELNLY